MDENLKGLAESPDAIVELAQVLIDEYKEPIKAIAGQILDLYAEFVDDDRHYQLSAKNKWKSYKALIEVGFSKDQALMIMLNNNAEIVKNLRKANENSAGISNGIKAVKK